MLSESFVHLPIHLFLCPLKVTLVVSAMSAYALVFLYCHAQTITQLLVSATDAKDVNRCGRLAFSDLKLGSAQLKCDAICTSAF